MPKQKTYPPETDDLMKETAPLRTVSSAPRQICAVFCVCTAKNAQNLYLTDSSHDQDIKSVLVDEN